MIAFFLFSLFAPAAFSLFRKNWGRGKKIISSMICLFVFPRLQYQASQKHLMSQLFKFRLSFLVCTPSRDTFIRIQQRRIVWPGLFLQHQCMMVYHTPHQCATNNWKKDELLKTRERRGGEKKQGLKIMDGKKRDEGGLESGEGRWSKGWRI